jgi:hypothetical protein
MTIRLSTLKSTEVPDIFPGLLIFKDNFGLENKQPLGLIVYRKGKRVEVGAFGKRTATDARLMSGIG